MGDSGQISFILGTHMFIGRPVGTPQGDSVSPIFFVIYLEATLRDLRDNLPQRPQEYTGTIY